MSKKKIGSMSDLAASLGLSRTTVSLCLSGKARQYKIPPETVERVRALAAESGFVPNVMAQSIGATKKRTVGFLLGIDSFSSKNQSLMRHAIGEFSKRGWNYHLTHYGGNEFSEAFVRMKGLGVSAVLAFGSLELSSEIRGGIAAYLPELPLYLLDYPFYNSDDPPPENVRRIGIERVEAYRDAFDELFSMGHERFLLDDNDAKIAALKQVLRSRGGSFDERCVVFVPESRFSTPFKAGMELSTEIIGKIRSFGCTAISLHDDELAAGVMSALLDAGFAIPGDVSVIGFDNIAAAPHFRIPLTSIDVPVCDMVDLAVMEVCGEGKLEPDAILPGRLVRRASIAAPAGA